MAVIATVRIDGLRELERALKRLGDGVRRKHIRSAANAGGMIAVRAARAAAPQKTGLLKKSLGVRMKVYSAHGAAVAIIGARTGFRRAIRTTGKGKTVYQDPSKYAHLVEGGTRAHWLKYTKILGAIVNVASWHPGTTPQPFLERSFESSIPQMLARVSSKLRQGIESEAKKAR